MFVFFILFNVVLITYVPSSGGQGVNLPYNLNFIALLGLALIFLQPKFSRVKQKFPQWGWTTGATLLMLPWLLHQGLCSGASFLALAILCWLFISRIYWSDHIRLWLLKAIFLSAVCHCVIALIQTFLPNLALQWYEYDWLRNSGRPYGIFQQVNLLASFLASGFACGYLYYLQQISPRDKYWPLVGLGIIAYVLALGQSRIGWLGAGFMFVMLTFLFWHRQKRACLWGLGVFSVSFLTGWQTMHHLSALANGQLHMLARTYHSSDATRWNIIQVTWEMIKEKPWSGWGYGSFEAQFAQYLMQHPALNSAHLGVISHPHNELLFAWYQGGIIALSGMLLMAANWLVIAYRALSRGATAAGYVLLLVPLLIHLNLEYPFYQSYIHLGLFVILLRLGTADTLDVYHGSGGYLRSSFNIVAVLFGLVLVSYSSVSLYANWVLTGLERQHLIDFPDQTPWYFYVQPERTEFDSHIAALVKYNVDKDDGKLQSFYIWAEDWSTRHTDKNVLANMISIDLYFGRTTQAKYWQSIYSATGQ